MFIKDVRNVFVFIIYHNIEQIFNNKLMCSKWIYENIIQSEKSIDNIQQRAKQYRADWINYSNIILNTEKKLDELVEQIKEIRQENQMNDLDLNDLKEKLDRL